MRRLILGVALLALIVGAAALGFAAGGHATSNQLVPCPYMCHVNGNGTRDIELHWGDHLTGDRVKVFCGCGRVGFCSKPCCKPGANI